MHRLYLIISAVLLLPLSVRAQLANDEACGAIPMGKLELGNTLAWKEPPVPCTSLLMLR